MSCTEPTVAVRFDKLRESGKDCEMAAVGKTAAQDSAPVESSRLQNCRYCHQLMRLEAVSPHVRHTNLDVHLYQCCDCCSVVIAAIRRVLC
jgi:hypothetical protein